MIDHVVVIPVRGLRSTYFLYSIYSTIREYRLAAVAVFSLASEFLHHWDVNIIT